MIFSNKFSKDTYIFVICLLISVVLSFFYLRLPEFDFYSYHYYNGWAFLNNRLDVDIMPCAFRTYFNPLLDALNYFLLERLNNHPLLFVILSSLKYGFLIFIAYKLYDFVLSKFEEDNIFTTIFCFIAAAATPIAIYCIGFEMTDIQIAVLLMLGFYIFLKNIFNVKARGRFIYIFISAFIMGLALGLKYTAISFVVSMFITMVCLYKKIEHPVKTILWFIFGVLCGFSLTGGFWMVILYSKFQNPLFPYFNNIFKSPMAEADSVISSDFYQLLPQNFIQWLLYPLKNTVSNARIGFESRYFDLKIVLGFIAVILSFLFSRIKTFRENIFKTDENFSIFLCLLLVVTFTYYINNFLFANIRYIIPIFIIIPIVICVVIKFISKPEYYNHSLVTVLLLIFATIYVPTGARIDWLQPNKVIMMNDMQFKDNSTVICGNMTACFLAPHQNPNVKYIGYSLDKKFADRGYYSFSNYKSMYFTNSYLKGVVKNILQNENDVYFVYASKTLGREMHDLDLYENSLSSDLGKMVDLTNCKNLRYFVYDMLRPNSDVYVCKIK